MSHLGQMTDFFDYLRANFGNGFYTVKDYVLSFNKDVINPIDPAKAYDVLKPIFNEYLGDVAKLTDNLGVQIKMSAMIKEVVNYGGLVDILYLGRPGQR